jgi:hypothetical protein
MAKYDAWDKYILLNGIINYKPTYLYGEEPVSGTLLATNDR